MIVGIALVSSTLLATDFKTMADRAVASIRLNQQAQERLEKYSDMDTAFTYRVIDIVKLKGSSGFTILIAKYKDGESYYDLTDILFLDEYEFFRTFKEVK